MTLPILQAKVPQMLNESRVPASYLKKLRLGVLGNWTKTDYSFTGQFYFSPSFLSLTAQGVGMQGSTRRRRILGPREESRMSRAAQLEPQLDLYLSPGFSSGWMWITKPPQVWSYAASTLKGKELEAWWGGEDTCQGPRTKLVTVAVEMMEAG